MNIKNIIIVFLFIYPVFSEAQNADAIENAETGHQSITIVLLPNFNKKASILPIPQYKLNTSPQFSVAAGVNYEYGIYRQVIFIVGVHGGFVTRNLEFSVPKDEFNPPFEGDVERYGSVARESGLFYIRIPLNLRYILNESKHSAISVLGGVSLMYTIKQSASYSYMISPPGLSPTEYLLGDLEINKQKLPWTALNFGISYEKKFKNLRSIGLGVTGNFSLRNFVIGNFYFDTPNGPTASTTYKMRASFVGLELKYMLFRFKRSES